MKLESVRRRESLGVLDDLGQLSVRQASVQGHRDRAQPGDREDSSEIVGRVLSENPDSVAGPDVQPTKASRQMTDAVRELRPVGQPILMEQRRSRPSIAAPESDPV